MGIVLAGGTSRRMGRNKALLPAGTSTLIETVVTRLREACGDDLLLVTNDPGAYGHLGIRMVPDALPPGQSLVGVYTGILHAKGPAFICACDMPFLNPSLVRYLTSLAGTADAVVPRHDGLYEPLHAVYAPGCLDPIRRCIARQGRNTDFLPEVHVRIVDDAELRRFDPALRSFLNVNTPDEYAEVVAP
jgi:molybdopterin-guanine dinucleotide biosynthesis protein A